MFRAGISRFMLVALTAPTIATAASAVQAPEPSRTIAPDVLDALRQSETDISSLTVVYTYRLIAPGQGNAGRNPKAAISTLVQRLTTQKHLVYTTEREELGKQTGDREYSFDGNTVFLNERKPRDAQGRVGGSLSKLNVARLAADRPRSTWFEGAYFHAAGFTVPTTSQELHQRSRPRSTILRLLDDGGQLIRVDEPDPREEVTRVEIEANNPVVAGANDTDIEEAVQELRAAEVPEAKVAEMRGALEEKRRGPPRLRYIFFLDRGQACAVLRQQERTPAGVLLKEVMNEGFTEVAGTALRLPRRCRIDYFNWPIGSSKVFDAAAMSHQIVVTSLSTTPMRESDFTLRDYDVPGSVIAEMGPDGKTTSRVVPATAVGLDAAIKSAAASRKGSSPPRSLSNWWLASIVAGGALVAVAVLLWLRRQHVRRYP